MTPTIALFIMAFLGYCLGMIGAAELFGEVGDGEPVVVLLVLLWPVSIPTIGLVYLYDVLSRGRG